MLTAAGNALVRTFFAPPCAACRAPLARPLAGPICEACWLGVGHLIPPLCVRCGDGLLGWQDPSPECPRCRAHQPVLTIARSAGAYDGALREIIHAFKFRRRRAPDLCCAVPEDCPVPSFLDGTKWKFAGTLHGSRGDPCGFDREAARLGVHLNGFYLFADFSEAKRSQQGFSAGR